MRLLPLFALAMALPMQAAAEGVPADWFAFDPGDDLGHSVIDASGWLDAPAGRRGGVRAVGEGFAFKDGTPVRFWGVNIGDAQVYAEQAEADRWAAYFAKYGVNAVRFHKFTWSGYAGQPGSTAIRADLMDRLDYFSAALARRGIYYGWSHIYGHRPGPADRERLLAYDEIAAIKVPWDHLSGSTSGLVNFAPDLQALNIELTVNMLNHRNPHTGLRYAEDPALAFLEFQNEDNIFWSAIEPALDQAPTYRALLNRMFSDWLRRKYGSHEALLAAWGEGALQADEHLDRGNIYPRPNHGWFDAAFERAEREGRAVERHYLDRAQFLYETQAAFYDRFVRAVRATGYEGPIVASGWQAGGGITHFYNLHADYRAGIIDRHNYFGGGTGHVLTPGKVEAGAMVSAPGSGLLGTGLQAVRGRPFALSEWMSLLPNEWTAEAAPIIAAYGMGLQGWDASYAFASNEPGLSARLQTVHGGVYSADSPLHMALYPALARMVYRGDVREGPVVSSRNVHLPDLREGRLGFRETVRQDHDVKSFGGTVPAEALAVGRVLVSFTDRREATAAPDLSRWRSAAGLRSATGQLTWGKGYFIIDTPGTQGVVGFAAGRTHRLGDMSLRPETPFTVALVTSLDRERPISRAKSLLVTTVARARNTGMRYRPDGRELIEVGGAPVLMEPVRLTLKLRRAGRAVVHVLDHAGRRTGRTIPVRGREVALDGARHRTLYYEIEYPGR
jgi:hypothetical protein